MLARSGPADWQLAGMICKTLWNFSEGVQRVSSGFVDIYLSNAQVAASKHSSTEACFGAETAEDLMDTLSELLGVFLKISTDILFLFYILFLFFVRTRNSHDKFR